MRQIYLDYNATTPIAPSVQEAMQPFITEFHGNPSSTHWAGRVAAEAVEDARGKLSAVVGCTSEEIVFTSGGTESNNMAILGVMLGESPAAGGHLVISAIEHPAVSAPAAFLERMGYEVSRVSCDSQGVVDPDELARHLTPQTRLVSVMHANNEVGTIQPIQQIGEICRMREILFHTDAAQTVGKVRTQANELNVDLLTIAGHKVYAPKGVGALYIKNGVALERIMHGADHESGIRPGTENVPYIVALGKASELAIRGIDEASDRMAILRDRLSDRLQKGISESLTVHGDRSERLPNTLSVAFPRVHGHELLSHAAELCASTGSACHSDTAAISPTLAAMGVTTEVAAGTVRLSLGWDSSEEDIDRAASLLIHAWESLL